MFKVNEVSSSNCGNESGRKRRHVLFQGLSFVPDYLAIARVGLSDDMRVGLEHVKMFKAPCDREKWPQGYSPAVKSQRYQ